VKGTSLASANRRMQESLSYTSSQRYIALCLWVLVFAIFSSLAWQWIALNSSDKELAEYVEGLVRRSAYDHRSPQEIRALVLTKAEQLSIPVHEQEINVSGLGESLQTTFSYDTAINVPLLKRELYRMEFTHQVRFKPQF
jgi:hypothetical protein